MARYLNHYECDHSESLEEGQPPADWDDEWDCMCNDRCPVCNHECSPVSSDDLDEDEPGDGGRTRIGNTPTCEDCGESDDNCTCGDDEESGGQVETGPPVQTSLQPAFDAIDYAAIRARRAQLAADPSIIQAALPQFMDLLREFDARMREGDVKAAMLVYERADAFADDLQGGGFGTCCDDGACTLLENAAAAPDGTVPMWGQKGNIVLPCSITKARFEYDGIFGTGTPFSFSIHAVEWDRRFFSETGYRSFCGIALSNVPLGSTVADWLVQTIRDYNNKELKGNLPFISREYRERNQPAVELKPEPVWIPAVAAAHPAAQLSLF